MRASLLCVIGLLAWSAGAAAETGRQSSEAAATLEFNWDGVPSCSTLAASPAFTIRHAPKDARRVRLFFTQGDKERGGQEIDLPASGVIPAGALRTWGPCNADMYRWTAVFKSATGQVVGEIWSNRFFPETKPTR